MSTYFTFTDPLLESFDIIPDLVIGMSVSRAARTIEHEYASGSSGYSLRADGPRAGTLRLFFTDSYDAGLAFKTFAEPIVFLVHSSDVFNENIFDEMSFVRQGDMTIALVDTTENDFWTIDLGFQEIYP